MTCCPVSTTLGPSRLERRDGLVLGGRPARLSRCSPCAADWMFADSRPRGMCVLFGTVHGGCEASEAWALKDIDSPPPTVDPCLRRNVGVNGAEEQSGVTVPPLECGLDSITIENLRGFDKAVLNLGRSNTVLVGPNNSGKTSLLKILHWVFSAADRPLLTGQRQLQGWERDLLLPARDTRNSARRITLAVRINDGRRARRFQATTGVAQLRLQFRADRVFSALGRPRRGESPESTARALELLEALQKYVSLVYIPSAREAGSTAFVEGILRTVREKLQEKLLHRDRGGAPAEYRRAKRALEDIAAVAGAQAEELWINLKAALPPGMIDIARFDFSTEPETLVNWLAEQATLRISTGPHDTRMVSPVEVGSGLQSLLVMALFRATGVISGSDTVLLLEEPEAFLHPSAQRSLARSIFDSRDFRTVVSTHSTVVVDESVAADVVLVREHNVFAPKDVDVRRRAINSALMTGQGSEAIFARSVLLVEGPGDRAFFESLRRRLGELMSPGTLSELGIVSVGGKTRFAPWIQLLESYVDRHSGERPIQWLVVADSSDASTEVARAMRDGGLSIPAELERALREIGQAFSVGDEINGIAATRDLNKLAEARPFPVALLPIDLEYGALLEASEETVAALATSMDMSAGNLMALLSQLGSKFGGGPSRSPKKEDWRRAEIAASLPWHEISADVKSVLRRWLTPCLEPGEVLPETLFR
jgi:AAA ATPase domain/AAA domain, putative AbiEii toxin, Type IV TA system